MASQLLQNPEQLPLSPGADERPPSSAAAADKYEVILLGVGPHRMNNTRNCLEFLRRSLCAPTLTPRFYRGKGYSLDDVLFVLALADVPMTVMETSKLGESNLRELHREFKDLREAFRNLRQCRTFTVLAQLYSPKHILCCYHRTHHRKDIAHALCSYSNLRPSNVLHTQWIDCYVAWNTLHQVMCSVLIASSGVKTSKDQGTAATPAFISLDDMNVSGRMLRSYDSHWVTSFKMVAVDGRLMMEVTGKHSPSRSLEKENGKYIRRSCHFCIQDVDFGPLACPHVELLPSNFEQLQQLLLDRAAQSPNRDALVALRAGLNVDGVEKCPHCPSEYQYFLTEDSGVESVGIKRWVDFGTLRSPWDAAWTSLTHWTSKDGSRLFDDGALRRPPQDLVQLWRLESLPNRGLSIRDVFAHATSAGDPNVNHLSSSSSGATSTADADEYPVPRKFLDRVDKLVAQVLQRSKSTESV